MHQLGGEEMRSLRALKREDGAGRHVFMTERGAPMTAAGFRKMLSRLAVMWLQARQRRAGHARPPALPRPQNIMHTVRYTELTPDRFKNFWED